MFEAHASQTKRQTHPRTCASPVHRLAALSRKRPTGRTLSFLFPPDRLSTELRRWSACAQPHTRSVFIHVKCLSFRLHSRSPQLSQIFSHPTIPSFPFIISLFILLVVLCAPMLISQFKLPSQSECTVPGPHRPVQQMAE